MQILPITPYRKLENQEYETSVTLKIQGEDFIDRSFLNNKVTYTFTGCVFKELTVVCEESIDFQDISILFLHCSINSLIVEKIETKNISIDFSDSLLYGRIANSNIVRVSLNNCILDDSLFIIGASRVVITYGNYDINLRKWKNLLKKKYKTFDDVLNSANKFYLEGCSDILFSLTAMPSYYKEKAVKSGGFYFSPSTYSDSPSIGYQLKEEDARKIPIHLNVKYFANITHESTRIINAKLSSLAIKGYCTGDLKIEDSNIDHIFLSELSCEKWATLYNIRPYRIEAANKKLEIQQCNLEKFTFDNISFDDYDLISFFRNRFDKTQMMSCKFPETIKDFEKFKTVKNIHDIKDLDDNYYKNRYETFLRLKKILEDSGNLYEAQKLQAVSNEALKKIQNLPRADKFILGINSISNNYGLSISQPFLLILFFSVFFYILYLWSLRHIFNCDEINFNLIGYYFAFLDITHRADFMVNKDELNGLSYTIDYLNKIVSGFLIYQFIAAFRKYGKK